MAHASLVANSLVHMFEILSSSAAGHYSGAVRWENLQGEIDDGTLCNSAGGCTLSVTNSTFSSNEGYWAGAVYVDARQLAMTIVVTTFQNNSGVVCTLQIAGLPGQTQQDVSA